MSIYKKICYAVDLLFIIIITYSLIKTIVFAVNDYSNAAMYLILLYIYIIVSNIHIFLQDQELTKLRK
jgi:hypothetical protein